MTYLQITLQVAAENREAAGAVYTKYREPFLTRVDGAPDKQLLMRDEDVQVMHTFSSGDAAAAYLTSRTVQQRRLKLDSNAVGGRVQWSHPRR